MSHSPFIDTHSHIAWHVDDGIQSQAEAREALQMAKDEQILTILSTPHVIPGYTRPKTLKKILSRQTELKEVAREYGIDIYFGAEVMMNSLFLDAMPISDYPRINGTSYILMEFNVRDPYSYRSLDIDPLYEAKRAGYKPVIAHVERYFPKGTDWDVIDGWKHEGYVFQINATSLTGKPSSPAYKLAWELIESGMAHMVATDTHSAQGVRVESLEKAYAAVEKRAGKENADLLFIHNPEHLIQGEPVEAMKVISFKQPKKKWYQFGRR